MTTISPTAIHAIDSIVDGTIHQMAPPSRKRSFVKSCDDSVSTRSRKQVDQKAVSNFLSVGVWNDIPVSSATAFNLNTAAHTLGLLTQTTGSTLDSAHSSPRSADELDWDFVFGVCSFSTPPTALAMQQRKKVVPDENFHESVNAFLAVGAWNEIELHGKAPSNEELQHAASILGLGSHKNNDTVGWTTVDALLGEPMQARTPSPTSKLAAAKTAVAGLLVAGDNKKLGAVAGELTFGSSSCDCIATMLM